VGSEGFSRFPNPHSFVGSDGYVPMSIVPTVRPRFDQHDNRNRDQRHLCRIRGRAVARFFRQPDQNTQDKHLIRAGQYDIPLP